MLPRRSGLLWLKLFFTNSNQLWLTRSPEMMMFSKSVRPWPHGPPVRRAAARLGERNRSGSDDHFWVAYIELIYRPYGSMATVWEDTPNPPNKSICIPQSHFHPLPEGTTGSIGRACSYSRYSYMGLMGSWGNRNQLRYRSRSQNGSYRNSCRPNGERRLSTSFVAELLAWPGGPWYSDSRCQ